MSTHTTETWTVRCVFRRGGSTTSDIHALRSLIPDWKRARIGDLHGFLGEDEIIAADGLVREDMLKLVERLHGSGIGCVLARSVEKTAVPIDCHGRALLIEDDTLAFAIGKRMLQAGVPLRPGTAHRDE